MNGFIVIKSYLNLRLQHKLYNVVITKKKSNPSGLLFFFEKTFFTNMRIKLKCH